jgi:hypothetical protein
MTGDRRARLHFDFAHLSDRADYTFRQSQFSAPLRAHDEESRVQARSAHAMLALVPDDRLTHYADVELPESHIVLMYVTTPRQVGGNLFDHPVHMAIHVPARGREIARAAALAARGDSEARLHAKLALYAPSAELIEALAASGTDPQFPEHIADFHNAQDAAQALLFHHCNLVNLNASDGGSIPAIILQDIWQAVTHEPDLWLKILEKKDDWLVSKPVGPDGTLNSLQPSEEVSEKATKALAAALRYVQNNAALEGQQWNARYGATSAPYGGSAEAAPVPAGARAMAAETISGGVEWTVKMISDGEGLSIDAGSVAYAPPTATGEWKAAGLWSANDDPPLTKAIVDLIKAGKVGLKVYVGTNMLLGGTLVYGAPDPESGIVPLTVALAAAPGAGQAAATASVSLNAGKTGLSFDLAVHGVSGAAHAGLYGEGDALLFPLPLANIDGTGTLSFECTNRWLRHLALFVEYVGVDGESLEPKGWNERLPGFLQAGFQPNSKKKFVELIPPVTTVFGIPIPPDATDVSVPIWDEVHTVRFHFGGLGRGAYDVDVCPMGITVTALAELALPVFLLAAGTAVDANKMVKNLFKDREVLFACCKAGAAIGIVGGGTAYIVLAQDPGGAAKQLAEKFGPMLLSPATSLGVWVAEKMVEGAAERAIPFVDIALAVINFAVTAAQLAETTVEVLQSPFVYKADITRSMDLEVTLKPFEYHKFPDYHDLLQVTVLYDSGATTAVLTEALPATTLGDSIKISFKSLPVAGRIRVVACFKAHNGWQSGQGYSDWTPATPTNGLLTLPDLLVKSNKIPYSPASIYNHIEKIGMVDGRIGWIASVGQPPVETENSESPFGENKKVLQALSITTAQEPEMIGYCWQAKGLGLPPDTPSAPASDDALYTVQNVSVGEHPDTSYAHPAVGFTERPGIAYNLVSGEGDATNFFIDSSNPDFDGERNPKGGFHLRSVPLAYEIAPAFGTSTGQSYGRFPRPLDRYVYHPQGYVFGIYYKANKLFRAQLPAQPVADDEAVMASMSSGSGARDGMMDGPTGIAVALDGRILVLESANQRVQAFDIYGNAVPYFANPDFDASRGEGPGNAAKIPTVKLQPREGSIYLDLSVESEGYIYVLSETGGGSDPAQYFLDIYKPNGAFLATTPNVAAARIVVNILRDLYTLNYEQFLDASGRVQPSISMWLLPPPPA